MSQTNCLFAICIPLDNPLNLSSDVRKPVFRISDQVGHKPGCTVTEDGKRLEISDSGSREIILSV